MVYKFLVGSEEAENFKLEIMIDSEDTFMRLRNTILDAAGYDKDQVDSFYICDEEWNKEREVTVMDMGLDSDRSRLLRLASEESMRVRKEVFAIG